MLSENKNLHLSDADEKTLRERPKTWSKWWLQPLTVIKEELGEEHPYYLEALKNETQKNKNISDE